MSISFTYCGVACGVISVDDKFYIGIDPDLSPKGTLVQFNGFVSKKQTDVNNDKKLLDNVNIWLKFFFIILHDKIFLWLIS